MNLLNSFPISTLTPLTQISNITIKFGGINNIANHLLFEGVNEVSNIVCNEQKISFLYDV